MSNKWGFINEAASYIISDKQQALAFISIWLAVVRLAERYFNILHGRACFDMSGEKQVNCASENSSSART